MKETDTSLKALTQTRALRELFMHAQQLACWQKVLERHLEQGLRSHCSVAAYEQGRLTLAVSSSALAARLRYSQKDLLTKLIKEPDFSEVKSVHVIISPIGISTDVPPTPRALSLENAQLIRDVAEHCSPELQASLRALATHGDKRAR